MPPLRDVGAGAVLLAVGSVAIDNGLGQRPPMGWRSWNLFGKKVNQRLIQSIMDGMVDRKRMVDGKPTSLCDLGYCDVGLDDMWQRCTPKDKRIGKYSYHTDEGAPIVNLAVFPDLAAMTAHAHSLGLRAGWYANNCICKETESTRAMYELDVKAVVDYGFDAIKLDRCGSQKDVDLWAHLLNATGRPVLIESCHWGYIVPNETYCQWNFFRTSGDIRAKYGSMLSNLLTTVRWARAGLSRPGCWAYPDMLEVGCKHGPGRGADPGLSPAETRSHFGAWCIVSSPLTLSHDVNSNDVMDQVWPVIANREAIAVNQAWAGHSGSPFRHADTNLTISGYADQTKSAVLGDFGVAAGKEEPVPRWHYFYKPLPDSKVAVLLMNHAPTVESLTLNFADIPGSPCSHCLVRDVWAQADLGVYSTSYVAQNLAPHDSAFLILSRQPSAEVIWLEGRKELAFVVMASLLAMCMTLRPRNRRRCCCGSSPQRTRSK